MLRLSQVSNLTISISHDAGRRTTPEVVGGGAVDVGGDEVGAPVEVGGAVVGGPVGCTEVVGIDEAGIEVLEAGAVGTEVVASVGAVAAGVDDTPEVGGACVPVAENASGWPNCE